MEKEAIMFGTAERTALWWVAANTLACTVVGSFALPLGDFPEPLISGAIVGAAQWGALRSGLKLSPGWIIATSAAWATGIWLHITPAWPGSDADVSFDWMFSSAHRELEFQGLSIGLAAGSAQCGILWGRVQRPLLWLPVTAAALSLGWGIGVWAAFSREK
ncbi:MAG: hypothetical protein U0Q18_04410 [Bryobacteraceae bacterium]